MTGAEFTKRLNRPLLVSRDFSPLRETLSRLSEDRRLAIALDRRIDPGRLVRTDLQAPFFDTGIAQLVEPAGAAVTVAGETVFVTTPELASTFRTRIALSQKQLESLRERNFSRQLDLARKVTTSWPALSTPLDLLGEVAKRYDTEITNLNEIPYDLWDAGTISQADFITTATWIAAQYDFELNWIDANRVELVPVHSDPNLEQEHIFRGRTRQQVVDLLKESFPELSTEIQSDRLRLRGRVEQHEAVSILLGNRSPRKQSSSVASTSLANRRFTLRMMNRPLVELLDLLEKQGIQIERHTDLLTESGIHLNQPITLELQDATIDTLLTQACSPLGLTYSIDGTQIELLPARRPMTDPVQSDRNDLN